MNHGERELQDRLGTRDRADAFQARQARSHLNDRMRHFIGRQEMMFLATADAAGGCDNTFRAGPPGFVRVLDEEHLSWPEYRGNGVMASIGNLVENPNVGLLFVDFFRDVIGLHVNGHATVASDAEMRRDHPQLPADPVPGRRPERWVNVFVEEAYIHCAKHIPRMAKIPRQRGPEPSSKKSDYFIPGAPSRSPVPDQPSG